jgi:hypothetical protein
MTQKQAFEPSLSLPVRLINAIGTIVDATKGLSSDEFSRDAFYEAAMVSTGLDDFGDPYFEEGLSVLLESAKKDVEFHFLGKTGFKRLVTLHLANRLALIEEEKSNPNLSQTSLTPPVIITGLPRSGTTFLHRMMLADPQHHAFPIWQMLRLFRHDVPDKRRDISKREMAIARLLFPSIDNIHYSRVDSPEECFTLLCLTFFSRMFWTFAPFYEYLDWYIQQDRLRPYQDYALILQAFQTYTPDRRFALKAPMHTSSIGAIQKFIPKAMIVQVHREPAEAFSSLQSLFFNLHSRSVKRFDLPRTIEHNLRTWDVELAQNIAMREANTGSVVDVYYDQLRSDPLGVVTNIYHQFGLETSDLFLENLKTYIRDHPQGSHGKHKYAAEDSSLNEHTLNNRFAAYREYYGLTRNNS